MNGLQSSAPGGDARTPYGAAELRHVHDANLRRAFVLAALLAVTAIGGGRLLADALAAPAPVVEPPLTWVPFDPLPLPAEPPSIERPAETLPSAPVTPPAPNAIPEPVPDPVVPDEAPTTIADNGAAATPVGVPGGDGPPSSGGVIGGTGPPVAPEPPAPVVPDPPAPVVVPPAPAPPSEPTIFDVVEVMPTVLTNPSPVYPEMARQAGIEGRVYVRARVGRDGRVRAASIVRSDNAIFDAAALDAVRRWTFTPGVQAGRTVEVWTTIPIRFRQTR